MASYEQEKGLFEHLLQRLRLVWRVPSNPNTGGAETGIDVLVPLNDGRTVGVQVTALDPHPEPGKARAEEKRVAGPNPTVYGGWAENDPQAYLNALVGTIERKIAIAERHSFEGLGLTEVWLLICAGIPQHGAIVSTIVMTPLLHEPTIEIATGRLLQRSKYDRCFFLPILGAEQALYSWKKHSTWKKAVSQDGIHEAPRASYMNRLMLAAAARNQQEVDRLCDEELGATLREMGGARS